MIVETALMLGGAIVTAVVGAPLAARLAQPATWRQYAPRDPQGSRTAQESRQAFEPLDLGPDPIRWPSEIERVTHGRPEPKWPSQTWDDPHFGARWKQNRPEMSQASEDAWRARRENRNADAREARRAEERPAGTQQRAAPVEQPPRRSAAEERQRAEQAAARAREAIAARAQQAREQFEAGARDQADQLRQRAAEAARAQAQRAVDRAAAAVGSTDIPSVDELERLVATVGLAGTVQEIMSRTGWDFRQAAQHLARARQQGR